VKEIDRQARKGVGDCRRDTFSGESVGKGQIEGSSLEGRYDM
jgi:hypothetical protein